MATFVIGFADGVFVGAVFGFNSGSEALVNKAYGSEVSSSSARNNAYRFCTPIPYAVSISAFISVRANVLRLIQHTHNKHTHINRKLAQFSYFIFLFCKPGLEHTVNGFVQHWVKRDELKWSGGNADGAGERGG